MPPPLSRFPLGISPRSKSPNQKLPSISTYTPILPCLEPGAPPRPEPLLPPANESHRPGPRRPPAATRSSSSLLSVHGTLAPSSQGTMPAAMEQQQHSRTSSLLPSLTSGRIEPSSGSPRSTTPSPSRLRRPASSSLATPGRTHCAPAISLSPLPSSRPRSPATSAALHRRSS